MLQYNATFGIAEKKCNIKKIADIMLVLGYWHAWMHTVVDVAGLKAQCA
jgi:hypothetical protein